MSVDRYVCCTEQRRARLLAMSPPQDISGIDYIEVLAGATVADPTVIHIVLVKPLPIAKSLTGANILITGGVRYPAPTVASGVPTMGPPGFIERYVVTVPGGQQTDFSTYHLAIVSGPDDSTPPSFFDPRLSEVDFSFKIGCPSDFDCAPDCDEPLEQPEPDPLFDYRTRDYPGFRRQMLDRLAELVPGFREDDAVDFTTTLVEALAYRADQQSYRLDWVGTEAFLSTARSRTSIARHARLVDYAVGEGGSARVFARFSFAAGNGVADGMVLAAGTPLVVRSEGLGDVVPAEDYAGVVAAEAMVFETVAQLRLWEWRTAIQFHSWADDECTLPKGSVAATLVDASGGGFAALAPGDFLVLAEVRSPTTGLPEDARRERRHAVRITRVAAVQDVLDTSLSLVTVEWDPADALPFDLVVQARPVDALASAATEICAEAWGNVMLADHGMSLPPPAHLGLPDSEMDSLRPALDPELPLDGSWRPLIDRDSLSRIAPVDLEASPQMPASMLMTVEREDFAPALALDDEFGVWSARRDLLESGSFSRDFVVETAIDGRPSLRFGDGVHGLAPAAGTLLLASGRFGLGLEGNIGPGALSHVVLPLAQQGAILAVDNPLPARGGAAPESISDVRLAAPQAFRVQERAVTAADYADAARRHEEVANAMAIPRWTGAWQTMLVYVDRKGGLPVDEEFRKRLLAHLEYYRLMGFDIALRGAAPAPLEIELLVCAATGELRSRVATRVREALRPAGDGSGTPGFFHPDNFTFGSPLYLSSLIAAVKAVKGVETVTPKKFQRLGRLPQSEMEDWVIRPGEYEVLQLEDDPSFPERGRLGLLMGGGG